MIIMYNNKSKTKNEYDDEDIPQEDLPQNKSIPQTSLPPKEGTVEPLPESFRPRKDGPGGE